MFEKILIANRGEAALRIQRACRELGIRTVAAYSEADADLKHVKLADEAICIGPAPAARSYLNAAAIIAAAEVTDAEAVHPGYGLLSEDAEFAEKVKSSGFVFIGPSPENIAMMGDKIEGRKFMRKQGLAVLPGGEGPLPDDPAALARAAREIGFPLMIKAAGGGGGRGMRVVNTEPALHTAVGLLRAEAKNAFGNDTLFAERCVENPRHIETQIIADKHGGALFFGARDCSVQRRHQKIIEEAPPPGLPKKSLDALADSCVAACRKMKYTGLGTFEFLFDGAKFYFIEMNTRLQVEHTVTEMIYGVDLVVMQIEVAAGRKLALRQKDIAMRGHAIECRVNAEHPRTFAPSPGRISHYHPPGGPGVRVDTHIYSGYEVPSHYDSLLAKIVAHGDDRKQALARMRGAIAETVIEGIDTNLRLHAEVLRDGAFLQGGVGTGFLADKSEDGGAA